MQIIKEKKMKIKIIIQIKNQIKSRNGLKKKNLQNEYNYERTLESFHYLECLLDLIREKS